MHNLLVLFDDYVQSFAINWLYAREWWVLPVIVLLLLWLARVGHWTFQIALIVWFVLILYVCGFDMHLHSNLAWPIVAGGVVYWYAREHWNRALAWQLPEFRPQPEHSDPSQSKEAGQESLEGASRKTMLIRLVKFLVIVIALVILYKWSPLVAIVVLLGIPTVLYLLARRSGEERSRRQLIGELGTWLVLFLPIIVLGSLPTRSLPLLLIILGCAFVLMYILSKLRGGERLLSSYIKHDPRMSAYLDCVRKLKGRPLFRRGACLLAENRLVDVPGLLSTEDCKKLTPGFAPWSFGFWFRMVFRLSCLPVLSWFFRLLTHASLMPRLDSKFVTDCLSHQRFKTWYDYEVLRYGTSADDYLNTKAKREPAGSPNAWLAMTEALAECHFFSNPAKKSGEDDQPDLLLAATLLSSAGELQHEAAGDLAEYRNEREDRKLREREDRELRIAIHFFNLSARCLELFLDPSLPSNGANTTLPRRFEQFCQPLTNTEWQQTVVDEAPTQQAQAGQPSDESLPLLREAHTRLVLFWQYLLCGQLYGKCTTADGKYLDSTLGPADAVRTMVENGDRHLVIEILLIIKRARSPIDRELVVHHIRTCTSYALSSANVVQLRGALSDIMEEILPIYSGGSRDLFVRCDRLLESLRGRIDPVPIFRQRGLLSERQMQQAGNINDERRHRGDAGQLYQRAGSLRVYRLCAGGVPPPPGSSLSDANDIHKLE